MLQPVYSHPPPHAQRIRALALLVILTCHHSHGLAGFTPNFDVQLQYDDNVRATTDDQKQSDLILSLNPRLSWQWLVGKHQFDLSYAGGFGLYRENSNLNYADHSLTAHSLFDHSYRLNTELEFGYFLSHDRPGDTDAATNLPDEATTWSNTNLLTRFAYGRQDSQGQLVLQLDYAERRNTNNDQEFRDYDKFGVTGTFYYRIAPNTRLLFETALTNYRYPNQDSEGTNQSSQSTNWLTGVTWQATAKTSGVFKIGHRSTQYDEDLFADRSGLALSLDGIWNPNTYTQVKLGAVQENRQSALEATGGFVYRGLHTSLQHAITPRTTLHAQTSLGRATYEDTSDRDYRKRSAGVGVTHDLLRWLDIGAEYRYEKQTSDAELNNFNRNLFMLKANSKFK